MQLLHTVIWVVGHEHLIRSGSVHNAHTTMDHNVQIVAVLSTAYYLVKRRASSCVHRACQRNDEFPLP